MFFSVNHNTCFWRANFVTMPKTIWAQEKPEKNKMEHLSITKILAEADQLTIYTAQSRI